MTNVSSPRVVASPARFRFREELATRIRARLKLDNALFWAADVRKRFGVLSPEYVVAACVVEHELEAFRAVAGWDS